MKNQNDSPAPVVLQLFHHFAQDGCWWEGIWGPDPLMVGVPRPGGLGLVTQIEPVCC